MWKMLEAGQAGAAGLSALLSLLERVPDLWPWLADVAGMSEAELDQQPLEALIEILDQLRKQPGASSFFRRLSTMLNISVEVTR